MIKHKDNTTAAICGIAALLVTVAAAVWVNHLVQEQVRKAPEPAARVGATPIRVESSDQQGYRRTLGLVLHLESEAGAGASGFPVARIGPLTALLTARHVEVDMDPKKYGSWTATTRDGRRLPVISHEHSDDIDVAVAWVLGGVETVRLFGGESAGDEVVATGYLAPGFLVSQGMVGDPCDYFAHCTIMSALVYHGMSGGPVVLRDGRVVGLVNGYLIDENRDDRPVLGVSFYTSYRQFESWLAGAITRVPAVR